MKKTTRTISVTLTNGSTMSWSGVMEARIDNAFLQIDVKSKDRTKIIQETYGYPIASITNFHYIEETEEN